MPLGTEKKPTRKNIWFAALILLIVSILFAYSNNLNTNSMLFADPLSKSLNGGWRVSNDSQVQCDQADFSIIGSLKSDKWIKLENTLPETDSESMSFVTIGYQVTAFVNSEEIYSFGLSRESQEVWGVKTHFVKIPDGEKGREIRLVLSTADPRTAAASSYILLGHEMSILKALLNINLFAFVLSIFLVFIAIFNLAFSLLSIILKRRKRYISLIVLAFIPLIIGISIFFNLAISAYYTGPVFVYWIISINNMALPLFTLLLIAADKGFRQSKLLLITAALQGAFLCAWIVYNLLGWDFILVNFHWILSTLIVFVLVINFVREFRAGVKKLEITAAIGIIFSAFILDAIAYYTCGCYNSMDFYLMISALPVLVLMMGSVALRFLQEESRFLNENAALRIEGAMLHKSYLHIEKYIEETRLIWHDIDKQFSAISHLVQYGDYDGLRRYLAHACYDMKKVKDRHLCDHKLVNAILVDKLCEAKDKGISVNCSGNLPENLQIQSNDLCSLLVNMLDNALEACVRIPDSRKKLIVVNLAYKNDFAFFSITNSSAGKPLMDCGNFLTSKTNKASHGFGISIIQRIVTKYHGVLDIVPSDDSFLIKVAIKDESAKTSGI